MRVMKQTKRARDLTSDNKMNLLKSNRSARDLNSNNRFSLLNSNRSGETSDNMENVIKVLLWIAVFAFAGAGLYLLLKDLLV